MKVKSFNKAQILAPTALAYNSTKFGPGDSGSKDTTQSEQNADVGDSSLLWVEPSELAGVVGLAIELHGWVYRLTVSKNRSHLPSTWKHSQTRVAE